MLADKVPDVVLKCSASEYPRFSAFLEKAFVRRVSRRFCIRISEVIPLDVRRRHIVYIWQTKDWLPYNFRDLQRAILVSARFRRAVVRKP